MGINSKCTKGKTEKFWGEILREKMKQKMEREKNMKTKQTMKAKKYATKAEKISKSNLCKLSMTFQFLLLWRTSGYHLGSLIVTELLESCSIGEGISQKVNVT